MLNPMVLFLTVLSLTQGHHKGADCLRCYSLYTNDCTSKYEHCSVLKYADDTVIIGNIVNNNETLYILEVKEFVNWWDINYLNLNVKKTMDIVVDVRKDRYEHETLQQYNTIQSNKIQSNLCQLSYMSIIIIIH